MRQTITRNPVMCAPWYLMAGYAYEVLDEPIISDGAWDDLCKFVKANLEAARSHRHGHLIDTEALDSATAGYLKEDYLPSMTKSAAASLAGQYRALLGQRKRP